MMKINPCPRLRRGALPNIQREGCSGLYTFDSLVFLSSLGIVRAHANEPFGFFMAVSDRSERVCVHWGGHY